MRYVVVFSTVFVIFGVGLVYGSLLMVPYTITEEVRVDLSRTWVDETFVLMPFQNMTAEFGSGVQNESIFQVDMDSSDLIVSTILSDISGKVWFTIETRGDATFFWTEPRSDISLFVFYNPSSAAVNVTAKVTEFYLKATEYRHVTYYRSFLDSIYGYVGIIAIIAGTALNILHASLEARKRKLIQNTQL